MKKDYPDLIALATRLLPREGGHLWVSANTRKGPSVLRQVQEGLRRAGRAGAVLELGGLPPDFPTPGDWPESRYPEVCQLHVGPSCPSPDWSRLFGWRGHWPPPRSSRPGSPVG